MMSNSVLGWRCAPGINETADLIQDYPDPDDMRVGLFNDNWLLSALSMIATAAMHQMPLRVDHLEEKG
jgi:hypothetical protein